MNSLQNYSVVAALDIGSNSVRLLVAESRGGILFPVFQDRIASRLFAGFSDGVLDEKAIERTKEAIERLTRVARVRGAEKLWAFGTSAMRDGHNRDSLIACAEAMGVPLEVLSGEMEAQISFAGTNPKRITGMIDIGGGSTELLVGRDKRVMRAASVQLGAVRLMQDMGGRLEPDRMIAHAERVLLPAWEKVKAEKAPVWVGLGGTITSLAAMELTLACYDPDLVERYPVTAEATRAWLYKLCAMHLDRRKEILGLNPERADILPYGVAILSAFFAQSGTLRVLASDRDNLLGYLMKKMDERVDKLH